MESIEMIIEVDAAGRALGLRVFDFGDADVDELSRLNDLAEDSLKSTNCDWHIIKEGEQDVDSIAKPDFGTPGNSEHVGDPDFEGV